MVESAKLWCGDDWPWSVFYGSSLWRVAVEAHVTAAPVVVGQVLQESPEETSLAERDDVSAIEWVVPTRHGCSSNLFRRDVARDSMPTQIASIIEQLESALSLAKSRACPGS